MAGPGARLGWAMLSITTCSLALAGCGSGSGYSNPNSVPSASPAATSSPLFPSPSTSKVEGDVFTFQNGPISGAQIGVFQEQGRSAFSGALHSDGVGRFVVNLAPDIRVWFFAVKDGFVQPCGASVDARSDQRIDVEMVTASSLDSLNPPLPQFAGDPAVTGMIFEMTAAGRTPVVGADLYVQNVYTELASTRSDRRGAFYLCKLPDHINLSVVKEGYLEGGTGPFDGSRAQVFEIEMKRR